MAAVALPTADSRPSALALDVDGALGDTRPLWRAWLDDAARRLRIEELTALADDRVGAAAELDRRVGNWRVLLERFAEDNAPVHLRPNAETSAALRRLQATGVRLGAWSDAPEELVRVALSHLGAARRLDAVECGDGALERLLGRLGPDAGVVRTADELHRASA
jgi:phosphoglycolate phosphatase-like HAD superfamily hydrolase